MRLVRVVRNVEFGELFDSFFIAAITTILLVRFYLKLTGYPQIGSSTLHISHLLPGSLLMLAATLILLAAVNRAARSFAALIAGIGFGLAWDELGKFITKDNNYFFHATPGLIYLTFVILYLVVRYAAQRRLSQDDYMANVIDLLKDAAIKDLDEREYRHAKDLFARVSKDNILYEPTKQMLEQVKPNPERQPTFFDKVINEIKKPIVWLSHKPFFARLIIVVAIIYGITAVAAGIYFYTGATLPDTHHVSTFLEGDESDLIGGTSALVSAFFAGLGAFNYLKSKIQKAYKYFEQGLLVNIFIGQIVLFFKSQEIALTWLAITLFLLVNLKLLANEENRHSI